MNHTSAIQEKIIGVLITWMGGDRVRFVGQALHLHANGADRIVGDRQIFRFAWCRGTDLGRPDHVLRCVARRVGVTAVLKRS